MEDGEGVRFWITFRNDGTNPDRLRLKGCNGTPRFEIRSVLIGKHKRPTWQAKNIEAAFKNDTWVSKELAPGDKTTITLNIVAPTTAEGCHLHVQGDDQVAERWDPQGHGARPNDDLLTRSSF